ncbi:iron-sulfur cluster assembly scaffold protein [Legionella fallonii]|uniref:NifU family iron binding protein, [Fe-S] cluster formation/repair protein IscU, HesB n=1 Tax=Legionella fallonii LLAP-10 TaxID=1212491 RepID=A0A098G5B8_9GAMM|nr:iron-sulfur cluster assembly scaffold protein [Legionella fallonii]CEG57176.1 NifU family iron binding protein [Fe-S] cluster formation/repair protein IscU, HesB [Legionella fallonii LLAP-10]
MMYNERVEDCFFLPRHVGILDLNVPLTVHFSSIQKNQSVTRIDLYLQCTGDTLITKACFKATGNPYVIAALEWLCRQIEGRKLDCLKEMNYQILVKELEIPQNQYPIALQVEDVYKEVFTLMKKKLEDYKS